MTFNVSWTDISAFLTFLALIVGVYTKSQSRPLPPGPTPWPIIGSAFQMPSKQPWETYAAWAKQYGDIFSVQVLGQPYVFVNTLAIAKELFERRGPVYSGRPATVFLELAGLDKWLLPFMGSRNDEWRTGRKFVEHNLRPATVRYNQATLTRRARELIKNLISDPKALPDHIVYCNGSLILSSIYGIEVDNAHNPFLKTAETTAQMIVTSVLPGSRLVNMLPFLRYFPDWLPGMEFKTAADKINEEAKRMRVDAFNYVKQRTADKSALPSMVSDLLKDADDGHKLTAKEERTIMNAAGSMFTGGADTTAAQLRSIFLILLLHPDVQKKAQAELDSVLGERMPTFADRANLPYINAVCMEIIRWRAVGPLGVPRSPVQDDMYNGYLIPKGSYVMINVWSILNDPTVFPEPSSFKPERFIDKEGAFIEDLTVNAIFGFGRRLCPGRHHADSLLWIVLASAVSTLNITHAKDADGNAIPVSTVWMDGIGSHPPPFECEITPRNARVQEILQMASENDV